MAPKREGHFDASLIENNDVNLYDCEDLNEDLDKFKFYEPEYYLYLKNCDEKLANLIKQDVDVECSDGINFEERPSYEGGHNLTVITSPMIEVLRTKLEKPKLEYIITASKAITAALQYLSVPKNKIKKPTCFKFEKSSELFSLVNMCLDNFYRVLITFLDLPNHPSKSMILASMNWDKVKMAIRSYLMDLTRLFIIFCEHNILVLLTHFNEMITFLSCLPTIVKPIVKRFAVLWSNKPSLMKITFKCVLNLYILCDEPLYQEMILKVMFVGYISSSKSVSLTSLPGINLLRKTYILLFKPNESISYKVVSEYIDKLNDLYTSLTVKKKGRVQSIYNWTYISLLKLCTDILCATPDKLRLQTLVRPLIQIILGCIRLVSTVQYLPLRFHCISMLNKLNKLGVQTDEYENIPILPEIFKVFTIVDFQLKHSLTSMTTMDFTCILSLTTSQLQEKIFKDVVLENTYSAFMDYIILEAQIQAFPQIPSPFMIEMEKLFKSCDYINNNKKLHTLLDKLTDTYYFVMDKHRRGREYVFEDTPISKYYNEWAKQNEQNEFNIPTITNEPIERSELCFSDDDDDDKSTSKINKKLIIECIEVSVNFIPCLEKTETIKNSRGPSESDNKERYLKEVDKKDKEVENRKKMKMTID